MYTNLFTFTLLEIKLRQPIECILVLLIIAIAYHSRPQKCLTMAATRNKCLFITHARITYCSYMYISKKCEFLEEHSTVQCNYLQIHNSNHRGSCKKVFLRKVTLFVCSYTTLPIFTVFCVGNAFKLLTHQLECWIMCRKSKKMTFELGCSTQNGVLFVVKW